MGKFVPQPVRRLSLSHWRLTKAFAWCSSYKTYHNQSVVKFVRMYVSQKCKSENNPKDVLDIFVSNYGLLLNASEE